MLFMIASSQILPGEYQTPWVYPQTIKTDELLAWEHRYFNRTTIDGCFTRYNELSANFDAAHFCITLYPTNDSQCARIPRGIYLDVYFSNLRPNTTRGQYTAYDYAKTTSLCMMCPRDFSKPDTPVDCSLIYDANFAIAHIRSLDLSLPVVIGRIMVQRSDLRYCFDGSYNTIYLGASRALFNAKSTYLCTNVLQHCAAPFCRAQLLFAGLTQESAGHWNGSQTTESTCVQAGVGIPDTAITFTERDGEVHFDIRANFVQALSIHPENVEIELFSECGPENITVVFQTTVLKLLSLEIPYIMENPQIRIWPGEITLQADILPNAADLNELIADCENVWARFRFLKKNSLVLVADFAVYAKNFSFTGLSHRVISCDSISNEHECLSAIADVGFQDLSWLECIFVYYFEKQGQIVHFATQVINDIQGTCWQRIDATYKEKQICLHLQKNDGNFRCAFTQPMATVFLLTFNDSDSLMETTTYDITQEDVCLSCAGDDYCNKMLVRHWRGKSSLDLSISRGDLVFLVGIQQIYNSNYMQLFSIVFYIGIGILVLGSALLVFYYLIFKQICRLPRRKRDLRDNLSRSQKLSVLPALEEM